MLKRILFSYWLVIAVMVALFSFSVRPATAHDLERPALSGRVSQVLTNYWAANGSWQSIGPTLEEASLLTGQSLALSDSTGRFVATVGSVGKVDLATGLPIRIGSDGAVIGLLYTGQPDPALATVTTGEGDNGPGLLVTGLAAVLLSLGLGWLLTRSIVRPLQQLNGVARRLAQGDYTARVGLASYGRDEISRLIQTFNGLAENIGRVEQGRRNRLADVSHDLRTPLNVIGGYLEGLRSNQIADRRSAEKAFSVMQGEVTRLTKLVEGLTGSQRIEFRPVQPARLVAQILSRVAPLAVAKKVELINRLSDLPAWSLDSGQLEQALYNLLENALRHTPVGGRIVVDGGERVEQLWISVADNGEGIDPAHLPHIFERGYQASPNRGSVGLGLAIVQEIVTAHGGEVRVHSDGPGRGSSFEIVLPLSLVNL